MGFKNESDTSHDKINRSKYFIPQTSESYLRREMGFKNESDTSHNKRNRFKYFIPQTFESYIRRLQGKIKHIF